MNKIQLTGRITKDIELRKTSSGTSIVQLDIAIRRNRKKEDGTYDTDFFNLDSFGSTADFIAKYCHKGDMIGIVGRLQNNNYEKDGKTVYKNSIIIEEIDLLSSNKNTKPSEETEPEDNGFSGFDGKVEVQDSDLPF